MFQRWYSHPELRAELRPQVEAALVQLDGLYPGIIDEACFIDCTGPEQARRVGGKAAAKADLSPDESASAFFASTFKLAGAAVFQASPYVSPDSNRWVVSNSTPLVVDGKEVALVHFEASLESLRERLSAVAGSTGSFRLVDGATGNLILDTRGDALSRFQQ